MIRQHFQSFAYSIKHRTAATLIVAVGTKLDTDLRDVHLEPRMQHESVG